MIPGFYIFKIMESLEKLIKRYRELGIDSQIDYQKFYLYSIITHSTAIEGSTVTEIENQLLFDKGISAKGRTIEEQMMNLDLKMAYEQSIAFAQKGENFSVEMLKRLSSLIMKNTGSEYNTALGSFSSANGDLRLLNVSAGIGGRSYMSFTKVPAKLEDFCHSLNECRSLAKNLDVDSLYKMSFDAHYELVTIHPWADGNGRMARLVMNQIQFENNLIPMRVLKEDKEEYVKSLAQSQEQSNPKIFVDFMTESMARNLENEIKTFLQSTEMGGENTKMGGENEKRGEKTSLLILSKLKNDPRMTSAELASALEISPKAVEKQIARLKKSGKLLRIGPDKGGYWEVP
ncbi:MAG: Fic family protein [Fibrobacteraceae bacterium]|nr:Fic family protein [Fibrobacteraceae bacterium]MCF0215950.1 Fic family protein [Fibrobacteraceae bacterium]